MTIEQRIEEVFDGAIESRRAMDSDKRIEGVDTWLAARCFITGMKAQEYGLDGKEMLQMFVGCVIETDEAADNYKSVDALAKALVKARREVTGERPTKT